MEQFIKQRFGQNLKFLRERAGLTQAALAEIIAAETGKYAPKSISSYEREKDCIFPPPEVVHAILNYFQVKYEHLTGYDLFSMGEKELEALIHPKTTGELRILTLSVDADNREKIELVREKASAGYIKGFTDTNYIRQLEKFHMPWLPPEYTYRAFEISGDSMPPVQSGSVVLGKYVEDFSSIKKGERYILITREGILFKRVYFPAKPQRNHPVLLLTSDNPIYEPYEISREDLLEVWQFYAYVTMCLDK
ncbi:MAG: LexA family transcriptional regulator [Bacteroidia bacterium]